MRFTPSKVPVAAGGSDSVSSCEGGSSFRYWPRPPWRRAAAATSARLSPPTRRPARRSSRTRPDSVAPKNAPAHWLPPEAWVYNHWLPYDEGRLYRVLGITRVGLWQQLRDDHRTLAQLAARHGWPNPRAARRDARRAARAASVGAARAAACASAPLRTITQGHLAQHLFFHSLHQFAIPSAAPDIFGVTDARVPRAAPHRAQPAGDRPPARPLAGPGPGARRSPCCASASRAGRPRGLDAARAGATPAAPPAQPASALARPAALQRPAADAARRARRSPARLRVEPGDLGRRPLRRLRGLPPEAEARDQARRDRGAARRPDSRDDARSSAALPSGGRTGPDPISAYNPSISRRRRARHLRVLGAATRTSPSATGGSACCSATRAGHARDRRQAASAPSPDSQSAYNPVISADGSRVAYQAVRDGRTAIVVATRAGRTRAVDRGARVGGERFADVYEPGLSADGSRWSTRCATGRVGDPRRRDERGPRPRPRDRHDALASRTSAGATGDGPSADRAISPDGRFVAFTSDAANLGVAPGGAGLFVRDLRDGPHAAGPDRRRRTSLDPVARARRRRSSRSPPMHGQRAQVARLDAGAPGRRSSAARRPPRRRALRGRVDLRRRQARRVRLDGDEPRRRQRTARARSSCAT